MAVDIRNHGLDYKLEEYQEVQKGCEVTAELYEPLAPSDIAAAIRDIKEAVAYFPIPVKLNGERINTLPKKEKWDHETEDGYIKQRNGGGVKVYNRGVYVCTYRAEDYGLSAIVLSKRMLEVNFARNDILVSKCEVWKRLRRELSKLGTAKSKRAATLTDEGRALLIKQFLAGELPYADFASRRVIRDALQAHTTLNALLRSDLPVCAAPREHDRAADRLRESRLASVLSPRTLEWFDDVT